MSALLDALGYVGDSLAKPGRAVRGVLAGRMDEGLAALPFSDSLGITDPTRAVSGRDLLGQAGMATGNSWLDGLAGFGAEVATDPLTFLGAGLGTALGRAAGRAAAVVGPRYATKADDVLNMVEAGTGVRPTVTGTTPANALDETFELRGLSSPSPFDSAAYAAAPNTAALQADRLLSSPAAARVLSEIPPDSRFLAAGAEGMAFRTPAGDVLRVGPTSVGAAGRPVDDAVLQATRVLDAPGGRAARDGYRVERVPTAGEDG